MKSKKQNRWRRLIRKAANFMKKNMWHTSCMARRVANGIVESYVDVFSDRANSFCMLGAMARVVGKDKLNPPTNVDDYTPTLSARMYSEDKFDTGDKILDEALTQIKAYYKITPLYRINDNCTSKEQVIQKLLAVANR